MNSRLGVSARAPLAGVTLLQQRLQELAIDSDMPLEQQQDGYMAVDSDVTPLQQQEHSEVAVLSYVASQEQQQHGDLAVHSVNFDVPPQ